jgi:hypothetical protein
MTTPLADMVTFHEDDHTYWLGPERVPSVSEILRPLTERRLADIPEHILNHKRNIGIAVHAACEYHDRGILDEDSVEERVMPYLEGYRRFLVDYAPEWTDIERIVFNATARYAGRLDRRGRVGNFATILDLKTSVKAQPETGLQLWAYLDASPLRDAAEEPSLGALYLKPDASYEFRWFADVATYRTTWDALLTLRRWQEEMK